MDDHRLISLIKEDNRLAFKQFFEIHYPPLCAYLYTFTNDFHEAEDLGQLVFVDFWNKRHQINITSSVKSYLYRMAYNQFLTDLRKQKKEASVLEQLKYEALQSDVQPTETEIEQKRQRLWKIIGQLPDRCQEVLRLKMEGHKYKEIAETLGLSVKTVESQMRVAFIKIREDYKDDMLILLLITPKDF